MLRAFIAFVKLAWIILYQNKKNTSRLFAELNNVLKKHGFTLTATQKKRIAFYTAQSVITNHWFSQLRGYKPSKLEIKHALYLGAFTPIADDLMDGQNITFQELATQQDGATADAVLFDYLYAKLAPIMAENALFKSYFEKAHLAQNQSLKQLQKAPLSLEQLKEISYNKGGYYTLLYRAVLLNPLLPHEEEAIYHLGAIMQLLNDLFDLHKDYHNHVQTLVTNTRNIKYIREQEVALRNQFLLHFKQLSYAEKNKKRALAAIMAIVTRGNVALDDYEKIQGENPHIDVAAYPRKTLIVDMELPKNVWRNLVYTNKSIR